MTLQHSAFLFDYTRFQSVVASKIKALEGGDSEDLRVLAKEVYDSVGTEKNWVLNDKGTFLDAPIPPRNTSLQNMTWGYWLLIVMSSYLQPTFSLGYEWTKLSVALHSIKWNKQDVEMVLYGLPAPLLIKSDVKFLQNPVLNSDTPYPYWIRPERCTYSGWLSIEEVNRLYWKLRQDENTLNMDLRSIISLPPRVSKDRVHISREHDPEYWYERIPLVYQQSIKMMESASQNQMGLYMVIYQEYGDRDSWAVDAEIG